MSPAGVRLSSATFTAVAIALGALACAPAVDPDALFGKLMSRDLEERQEANEKIEDLIKKGQADVFVRGLKSPNLLYRAQSIVFLGRMTAPEAREAMRGLLALDHRMLLPFNPIRYKPQTEKTDSRILAASLIQRGGGDPGALKVLLDGIDGSQSIEILTGTCYAVGALRDPAGIPFLETLSKRPELELVRAAVEAVGQFNGPEAFAVLESLTTHPSTEVRAEILSSLSARDDAAVLDLLERIGATDPSDDLRATVYRSLTRFKRDRVVPYLIDRLKDAPAAAHPAILETLGQITGQTLGPKPEAWARWWSKTGAGASAH